jgi:hypothetical protein
MKEYTFILFDQNDQEYYRKKRSFYTLLQARSYAFTIWAEVIDCHKIEVQYIK